MIELVRCEILENLRIELERFIVERVVDHPFEGFALFGSFHGNEWRPGVLITLAVAVDIRSTNEP